MGRGFEGRWMDGEQLQGIKSHGNHVPILSITKTRNEKLFNMATQLVDYPETCLR